jgi:hypothetical protein
MKTLIALWKVGDDCYLRPERLAGQRIQGTRLRGPTTVGPLSGKVSMCLTAKPRIIVPPMIRNSRSASGIGNSFSEQQSKKGAAKWPRLTFQRRRFLLLACACRFGGWHEYVSRYMKSLCEIANMLNSQISFTAQHFGNNRLVFEYVK